MQKLIAKYDYNYPDTSHTQLASIIKKNEKSDLEVRTIRRYISEYRNRSSDNEVYAPVSLTKDDIYDMMRELFETDLVKYQESWNPPSELFSEREQVQNENTFTTPGKYLVFGCIHAPFHNKRFVDAVLTMAKERSQEFSGLVLNGDFLDMNTLSAHDSGNMPIEGVNLGWEYEKGNELLDQFDDIFDGKIKGYINGNHEDRYYRTILKPDHYKMTGELRSPAAALGLHKRGYNYFEDWKNDYITLGNDLQVIHGIYMNEHVAKKHADVFQTNMMFAHCHRIQTYHSQNSAYAIGAGADFSHQVFNYANRAMKMPWNNGCAVVTIDDEGDHHVEVIKFKGNKMFYNGKQYV
jgi:hypothetical protein